MAEPTSVCCPLCQQPLALDERPNKVLLCTEGHRFDAAKQGYYNFLTGKGTNFLEDTSPMVQAREAFQAKGHYAPLAKQLATLVRGKVHGGSLDILDAGAGTGYYLGQILEQHPASGKDALALDISRYAMRKAAKVEHTIAVVWDLWRTLPSAGESRDVVLNCFAPHNPAEFARVLRRDGICIVVTAAPEHLEEVRDQLGMLSIGADKQKALVEKFAQHGLEHLDSTGLSYTMELDSADLYNLAFMGPAGHHLSPDLLRSAAESLGSANVNASFDVHLFVRRT